jgi:hypothetical protein
MKESRRLVLLRTSCLMCESCNQIWALRPPNCKVFLIIKVTSRNIRANSSNFDTIASFYVIFQSLFTNYPSIRHCIFWAIYSVLKISRMNKSMKITHLWDVTLCSLHTKMPSFRSNLLHPSSVSPAMGGSSFLRKVATCLPDYGKGSVLFNAVGN